MRRFFLVVLMLCFTAGSALAGGFDGNTLFFTDSDGTIKLIFNPASNVTWTWPTADGTSGQCLTTNASGTLSFSTSSNTAWDDIGNPDANKTLTYSTYTTLFTGASTAADQWIFRGTGAFGDVSVVRIDSATGNPTDGTVLEVVSHDTDADALLVTANSINSIQVAGSGNVNLTGGTGTIDYTDFDVSADGAVTIASDTDNTMVTLNPSVATTTAIDASAANIATALTVGANDIVGTTGLINYTNFDVDASGNVTAVNGTFSGNVSVTGTWKQDAIVPASAAPTTLTIDGAGAGGVTIGGTSTGAVTLGGGATAVNMASATDLALAGGKITVVDTANEDMVTLTNASMTTQSAIQTDTNAITTGKVIQSTADGVTSGVMLYLDSDGADTDFAAGGLYIQAYDGAATDFSVGRYGGVTIAGNSATDVITVTAGNVQVTSGSVDVDNGNLTVDTTQDIAHNISRNFAGAGTAAAMTVAESNASSTQVALQVTNAGTGNATGIQVTHTGDYPALNLVGGAARTGDVVAIPMANQLNQRAINITGAITSAAGAGTIEVHGTGIIPATASLLRLDADTAQPGDGDGYMMNIDDDTLVVATPNKYAVLIDSAANEALHVATGKALFDELPTFTSGIDSDGDIDVDFSANTEEADINTSALDYAADSAIVTITDAAGAGTGATNNTYLLRLRHEANGDAQDHFIVAEDNNGTDMFKVDSGGAMTVTGTATFTGDIDANGNIVGDGGGTLAGMLYTVTNDTDGKTLTIAECGTIQTNSGAIGAGIWNLPEASTAIGCCYRFATMAAQNLDINPDAADQILVLTNAAGDAIRNATVGNSIELCTMDATNWVSMGSAYGTWTDVN